MYSSEQELQKKESDEEKKHGSSLSWTFDKKLLNENEDEEEKNPLGDEGHTHEPEVVHHLDSE